MFKSALGIAVSLFILALLPGAPVQAADTTSAKKTVQKKTAAARKPRAAASAKTSTSAKSKSAPTASRAKPNAGTAFAARSTQDGVVRTRGEATRLHFNHDPVALRSNAAVVIDQNSAQVLFEKNAEASQPIASLTKLMTAMIVLEAEQDLDEVIEVTADDIDREKHTSSRLRVGSRLSREDMLHIALMSSENRAASALGRNYPGGRPAFVAAMNARAKSLGMLDTHFVETTGLSSQNVSSAQDLARLVAAAYRYPLIRNFSTDEKYVVEPGGYQLHYINSNRLVASSDWEIGLQKTGYIVEAGRCLVMQARIEGRPVIMVFLDSKGKDSRLGDAGRIRKWLETDKPEPIGQTVARRG